MCCLAKEEEEKGRELEKDRKKPRNDLSSWRK